MQLPKFFYLCEDGVWGVRKACADVFMPVSCVCSPAVRKAELSPLFINLLRDQSRWVRMAAFQALGPFISTFADPSITALLHNDNGEIVITEPDALAARLDELETQREEERLIRAEEEQQQPRRATATSTEQETFSTTTTVITAPSESSTKVPETPPSGAAMDISGDDDDDDDSGLSSESVSFEERRATKYAEKDAAAADNSNSNSSSSSSASSDVEEIFNSFHFWREPLPPVEGGEQADPWQQDETKGDPAEVQQATEDMENVFLSKEEGEEKQIPEAKGEALLVFFRSSCAVCFLSFFFLASALFRTCTLLYYYTHTLSCCTLCHYFALPGWDEATERGAAENEDESSKAWQKLPIITFQTFDNLTGTRYHYNSNCNCSMGVLAMAASFRRNVGLGLTSHTPVLVAS